MNLCYGPKLCILFIFLNIFGYSQTTNSKIFSTVVDTSIARQYLEVADSLVTQNQIDEAIDLVIQAQEIYKRVEYWEGYVACFNKLARNFDYKYDVTTSLEYLKKAEVLGKKYLPETTIPLANTLQQKAELFIQQDQQDSALYYLNQANDLYVQKEDWKGYAWSNIVMAVSLYYKADFVKMDTILNMVLKLDEQHAFPPKTEIRETVWQWQQTLYDETGAYEKAFQIAKQALDYRMARLKTHYDSSMLAINYHNLGAIYKSKGDFDEALRYFNLATGTHLSIAAPAYELYENYRHIGLCLNEKEQFPEALKAFKNSLIYLNNAPEIHQAQTYIDIFISIGRSYIENEQLDSAFHYLEKALVLSTKNAYAEDLVLLNLGLIFKKKNDLDRALDYWNKALKISERSNNSYRDLLSLKLFQNLGEAYAKKNMPEIAIFNFQNALKLLDKKLNIDQPYENPSLEKVVDKINFLLLLGLKGTSLLSIHQNKNELEKIHQLYQLASGLMDHMRQDYTSEGAKKLLSQRGRSIYESGIKVALMLYDSTLQEAYLHTAFSYAEKSKGLLLLESLQTLKSLAENTDTSFKAFLKEFKNSKLAIIFYERKLFKERQKATPDPLKISNWETELRTIRSTYEKQRFRLEKEFPDYYQLNFSALTASVDSIRTHLLEQSETAFIEYFMGDSTLYTFVITATDFHVFQEERTASLDKNIERLLQQQSQQPALIEPKKTQQHFENYTADAYELFKKILQPIVEKNHFDQLIIIPDGKLSYISFELLLTQAVSSDQINYSIHHLPYLIKNHLISYAYSGTLLLESLQTSKQSPTKNYGGFAPVFDDTDRPVALQRSCNENQLGTLAKSAESVQQAQVLFDGQAYFRQEASKSNFLKKAPSYRILHLSTHACVDDHDPMFNKIYFSDDHLNTYELFDLKLQADLAVLSACETGVGQLVRGEGVFSLARGFMQAGCPAVVTSLWNANDFSTSQIMMEFHKNLKNGQAKHQALHQAKLAYLESAPSRLSAPYYWATFIGVGNMEAITLESEWNAFYLGGIAVLILLFLSFFIKKWFFA